LAKYDKTAGGARGWRRDTSGSVQVDVMEGQLVIDGHFWEVADQLGDRCGHRTGGPQALDPNDECKTRKGIAAYSFSGRLDSNWSPTYAGKYSLVWALHVEGARLHTGGEFLTVNGVTQNYYARFSRASIKGDDKPNNLSGTPNDDAIYGYGGADRIHAWGGNDTLRLGGGSDKGRGGVATTTSVRWMGGRTTSTVVLALIAPLLTRGTKSQRGVRKSKGQARGSGRENYL
jgi:RTX calcium-binding nonapeptide repeat (4 copies)